MKHSIILPVIFSLGLLFSIPQKCEANLDALVLASLAGLGAAGIGGYFLNNYEKRSNEAKVITLLTFCAAIYVAHKTYKAVSKK